MGEATEEAAPTTFELEDFDPETGHRHDCRPVVPDWSHMPNEDELLDAVLAVAKDPPSACDCAAELYATAARRLDPSAVIDKIRPIDGDNILLIRGAEPGFGPGSFGDILLDELIGWIRGRGLPGSIRQHLPLIIILPRSQSLEVLDETEMNRAGWIRKPDGFLDEFNAQVIDAGGGIVNLLVDRDTKNYPSDGARVRVIVG